MLSITARVSVTERLSVATRLSDHGMLAITARVFRQISQRIYCDANRSRLSLWRQCTLYVYICIYRFKRLRLCRLPFPSTNLGAAEGHSPLRMASPFETLAGALDRTFQIKSCVRSQHVFRSCDVVRSQHVFLVTGCVRSRYVVVLQRENN